MPVHLDNEHQLLAQARSGNGEAFSTLFRQYDRNIFRLAMNITRNQEDAEDVLQETALKAIAGLADFHGASRFYTWLVRIAVNESLMRLRSRRTQKAVSLDEPISTGDDEPRPREIADWGESPEQRYSRVHLNRILNGALEALDPAYRMVVMLRDVEGFSNEEVAETLKISLPAVKSRLLRGRLMLRKYLDKYFRAPERRVSSVSERLALSPPVADEGPRSVERVASRPRPRLRPRPSSAARLVPRLAPAQALRMFF